MGSHVALSISGLTHCGMSVRSYAKDFCVYSLKTLNVRRDYSGIAPKSPIQSIGNLSFPIFTMHIQSIYFTRVYRKLLFRSHAKPQSH